MGIVVIGTAFMDIKGFPDGEYIPDGRNAGKVKYIHGGVARNVAEDIANVSLNTEFVSIVDDTALGSEIVNHLKKQGVNTDYVAVSPDGLGLWLAVFDSRGDVAGSISKRPDPMPILGTLSEKGDEIFRNADSVVLQVDLHEDILMTSLELAEKYNVPVFALISNMTIAAERRELLPRFACYICNKQEAGLLFMEDCADSSIEEMQVIVKRRVVEGGIPSMVVTLGEEGAVYADRNGESGYCAACEVKVKDTTGAGDAFCAGVACGLTYGRDLAGAVEIGTQLAASVITSSENVCHGFTPQEFGLKIAD